MATVLTIDDIRDIKQHGLTESAVRAQIEHLRNGYSKTQIIDSIHPEAGLYIIPEQDEQRLLTIYTHFNGTREKFVPASGAASRMFSKLRNYLDNKELWKTNPFPSSPKGFAFWLYMEHEAEAQNMPSMHKLLQNKKYVDIVSCMLHVLALDKLPKALIPFHYYINNATLRTPIDEHIIEGIYYAQNLDNEVNVHFTVSSEHLVAIHTFCKERKEQYEKEYGIKLRIEQSIQLPSTDTVALTPEGELFHDENGHVLFRPGGHGALIENLQCIDSDIIFIKNIDNVAREELLKRSSHYKKLLAGLLLELRTKIYHYVDRLSNQQLMPEDLSEIVDFCKKKLFLWFPDRFCDYEAAHKQEYLRVRLNRPIRVCGVVPNDGEPGGGPFWVRSQGGNVSLQIVEGAQIDMLNPTTTTIVKSSRYFNPVDIVCSIRDYKGKKFDLKLFVDSEMGLIVHKSYAGRDLVGLELPGLWNGSMANWLTVFVEVPSYTFTPVKEVFDLLRPEHRSDSK